METQALVKSGQIALPAFSLTPEGEQWIAHALEGSALVAKVGDEVENSVAVKSAQELKAVINVLENSRVEITAPALKFQRECKAFFDGKAQEAKDEFSRLTKLIGDYAALQVAKARAAENAKNEELTRLEREREAALAKANSHEEREVLQEHFNQRAAIEGMTPAPLVVAAKGQSVGSDLRISIHDIWALARAYPNCVRPPEIKLTETKALIRAGIKPPGITWEETTKTTIRANVGRTVEV